MKKIITMCSALCLSTLCTAQTPSCSVEMSELNFDIYNPVDTKDKMISQDFKFICTKNLNYAYKINTSGFLKSNQDKLFYKIMLGKNSSGVITANGYDQIIKMSAVIKAGQFVAPGLYADNLTFELIY